MFFFHILSFFGHYGVPVFLIQILEPASGTLQLVCGTDVVHQIAVDVTDDVLAGGVLDEEATVSGVRTTVTAQVQVPAVGGCNQTNVLALCLSTLNGFTTSNPRYFDVRR